MREHQNLYKNGGNCALWGNVMSLLVLARHGEHEYNAQGLACGTAEAHLTDKGRQEARDLGARCKESCLVFDVATTSPLVRCVETMQGFEEAYGNVPRHETIIRAQEHDYGRLEGKNVKEVLDLPTWTVDDVYRLPQDSKQPLREFLVEPWSNVCRRGMFSAEAMRELAADSHQGGQHNIIHFGHGLLNSVIAHYILYPEAMIPDPMMRPYHAGTGQYHSFEMNGAGRVVRWKSAKGTEWVELAE